MGWPRRKGTGLDDALIQESGFRSQDSDMIDSARLSRLRSRAIAARGDFALNSYGFFGREFARRQVRHD
jgi:hypothetical protein